MGKLNYRTATFQDGASLMDYAIRWGSEEDTVSGAYCRHCGVVIQTHYWPESIKITNYEPVEGVTVCSCTPDDPVNHN